MGPENGFRFEFAALIEVLFISSAS